MCKDMCAKVVKEHDGVEKYQLELEQKTVCQ